MLVSLLVAGLIAASLIGNFTDREPIAPAPLVTPIVSPTTNPPTPTPIPPTPTASPSATPAPTPTPTATFLPTPTPIASPPDLFRLTEKYAAEYGVDAGKLRHIAQCESGFNPQSEHLIYGGLFQFSPGAWKTYRIQMGQNPDPALRFDAEQAIRTAAYILSVNRQSIWPNCLP